MLDRIFDNAVSLAALTVLAYVAHAAYTLAVVVTTVQ